MPCHKWQRGQVASLLANRSAILASTGASHFDLNKVHGIVNTTRTNEVPPFQTILIHGLSCVKGHDKINFIKGAPQKYYSKSVTTVPGYSYLQKPSGRVIIRLRSITSITVVIKHQTTIATISAANAVLPMLEPRVSMKSATISHLECLYQDWE